MIIFDKKKAASAILSKYKDGRNVETEVKQEGGEHNEYTAFAEDLISAMADKSIQRVAACLKEFHEMIKEADEAEDKGE
jgi:hypothetical protein